MRSVNKQEMITHKQEIRNQAREAACEMTHISDITDQDK